MIITRYETSPSFGFVFPSLNITRQVFRSRNSPSAPSLWVCNAGETLNNGEKVSGNSTQAQRRRRIRTFPQANSSSGAGGSHRVGKRPYGYWVDKVNVLAELGEYMTYRAKNRGTIMTNGSVTLCTGTVAACAVSGEAEDQCELINFETDAKKEDKRHAARDLQYTQTVQSDPEFLTTMPTVNELQQAGYKSLAGAIRRHGWATIANLAGLKLSSVSRPRSLNLPLRQAALRMKPYCYWRDFANVARELRPLIGADGCLPPASTLTDTGRSDLCRAIARHGGWATVAARLGVKTASSKWADIDDVIAELKRLSKIVNVKQPTELTVRQIQQHGQRGLSHAIRSKHGGLRNVIRIIRERSGKATKGEKEGP